MENKTLIEYIRNFIKTCPYLNDYYRLGINYLDSEEDSYSIEELPTTTILKKYVDGTSLRQLNFTFSSTFQYSEEIMKNIENSGFYENFANWLEEINNDIQNSGEGPDLGSKNKILEISATSSGYLFRVDNSMTKARYQISCHLEYEKEG